MALNRNIQELEHEQRLPLLTIRAEGNCLDEEDACPMLMGLHGNASNAQSSINFWRAAATEGWLVAVPQSSQAMWKGAFTWDDREKSSREIQHHYQSLLGQYAINQEQVILAGHSMGAEIAAWMVLKAAIPASGFIAFGPGGPNMDALENWEPIIEKASGSGLRGYIILGEIDETVPNAKIVSFTEMLNRADIPCELEIVQDAGHEFVPAYEDSLLRAIRYISPLTSR